MARTKQATPLRRAPSSEYTSKADGRSPSRILDKGASSGGTGNGHATGSVLESVLPKPQKKEAGALQLLFAVGGIYGSFLTWALLQERLTKKAYGPASSPELFQFPVFLNTFQAFFAAVVGYIYLLSTSSGSKTPPIFPNRKIAFYLFLVAITTSLASPFGYASLAHIDYITFLLAKSCKLLPVMFLHITLFGKKYPLYKYLVVLAVTTGVAVFTLHQGSEKKHGSKASSVSTEGNYTWGLLLLSVNLLFDGLTNTTQDYIFQTFQPYTGPQMMSANNIMGTLLMFAYLVASPYLVHTGIGEYLGMDLASGGEGELGAALGFMGRHPGVWWDVVGFAVCGAVGQVFIFYTLSTFSSLLLVTITVTRKMLSMILSVVWFGHSLGGRQWAGVALVFGGIGAEGIINRQEKLAKEKAKAAAKKSQKKEL